MYSNDMVNFQESLTIVNSHMKKVSYTLWVNFSSLVSVILRSVNWDLDYNEKKSQQMSLIGAVLQSLPLQLFAFFFFFGVQRRGVNTSLEEEK